MTFEEADAKYPFDPELTRAEFEDLDGFEKLRGIFEPRLRRAVFEGMSVREKRARGVQWRPALTPEERERRAQQAPRREFIDPQQNQGETDGE